MRAVTKRLLIVIVVAGLSAGAYFAARGKQDEGAGRARNPVQTVRSAVAEKAALPITIRANGHVTALNSVEVRPQVQNIVRAIHVKEGQEVRAGDLLFTLDERGDASNLERARAQAARDRADLADAEQTLKRNLELQAKGFVSQAIVDSARNKVEALRATLQADQAGIQSSSVTLGHNRITASIAGRLGVINARPGSLAQPSAALTTIVQMDPVAVTFSVPEKELAHIAASYPQGDAPVIAQLPGAGRDREIRGKLIFIDNAVDQQTGTIRMKAQFANPDRALWPGAYVDVRIVSRTLPDAVVVPVQAVVTGPTDQFVYVVQPDGTVKMQKVAVAAIENGSAAVTGLAAGARIVIEGTQNLRPNSKVKEAEAAPAKPRGSGAGSAPNGKAA
ncbi:MAG TPA: efflux RND transporter periplasmic adaptor subunit [Paucimonas sp.]|nr:efflux RND transporter periplasmic adaptor subunit [Paucimonas sp.]